MSDLTTLERTALDELRAATTEEALRPWHAKYLGDSGEVKLALKEVGKLPQAERPAFGQQVNGLKQKLTQEYETGKGQIQQAELQRSLATEKIDVTLPGRPIARTRLHSATKTMRQILAIF